MTPSPPDLVAAVGQRLRRAVGLEPDSVGRDRIAAAVAARLAALGRDDFDYLPLLSESEDELRALVDEVVVPETWFFRDRQPFRRLRLQARALAPGQTFRVLSVPCSTGEEPYSIAMTLLGAGLGAGEFEVVAADVSPTALAAADFGSYADISFREREPEFLALRDRYCRTDGGRYVVNEAVRRAVRFVRANLAAAEFLPAEAPFNVIFCRNLFIYLSEEARRTALGHLRRLLLPGGALQFAAVESAFLIGTGFHRQAEDASVVFTPAAALRPHRPARAAPDVRRPARAVAPPPAEAEADDLTKARQAADAGRLEEAAALCVALAQGPPRAEVFCLLGVVRQAQGDFAEAERYFQRALYLDPRHADALLHAALLARRRGDERQAENYLRRRER
jgi:chemotaxis protein methyltransferase WspC